MRDIKGDTRSVDYSLYGLIMVALLTVGTWNTIFMMAW